MQKELFKALLKKVSDGTANDQEIALFNRYYQAYQPNNADWNTVEMGDEQKAHDKLKRLIFSQIKTVKLIPFWKKPISIAAAMLLLGLSATILFYLKSPITSSPKMVQQDAAPGGNKATLILADGRTINLSDAAQGTIATQAAISIAKTENGKVVYNVTNNTAAPQETVFNTIKTPIGGQYEVSLPDGTKVWLNSASSIKFPTSFNKLKERRVELTGEAYFEVTHNNEQPFLLKTGKQELKVLGTHFNVNNYEDENAIRTTLLEGSVSISNIEKNNLIDKQQVIVLKPGQQSLFTNATNLFTVTNADLEMATAWKEGNFLFNELELHSILKQLARWYNVKVDYNNIPNDKKFTGFISKNTNLSKVLAQLEFTGGIKFKIENKTIKLINI